MRWERAKQEKISTNLDLGPNLSDHYYQNDYHNYQKSYNPIIVMIFQARKHLR